MVPVNYEQNLLLIEHSRLRLHIWLKGPSQEFSESAEGRTISIAPCQSSFSPKTFSTSCAAWHRLVINETTIRKNPWFRDTGFAHFENKFSPSRICFKSYSLWRHFRSKDFMDLILVTVSPAPRWKKRVGRNLRYVQHQRGRTTEGDVCLDSHPRHGTAYLQHRVSLGSGNGAHGLFGRWLV